MPMKASASEKYILLMVIEHQGNKKAAAYYSGVSIRRAQEVTKKYIVFLAEKYAISRARAITK